MLRNFATSKPTVQANILNEVLSLNAQEFHLLAGMPVCYIFLNEVLSLNAQE